MRQALIIQPGAVGDVILTLPLVRLLKQAYAMTRVDLMGHVDRLAYLVPHAGIDGAHGIDDIPLHGLFCSPSDYRPDQSDRLVQFLQPYELVVTFLSDPRGHFEQNLIDACIRTHAVEVATISLTPSEDYPAHVAHSWMEQFVAEMIEKPWHSLESFLSASTALFPEAILPERQAGTDNVVILHPGSGGPSKCWPAERYIELARRLQQQRLEVRFLVGPAEQERWQPDEMALFKDTAEVVTDQALDEVAQLLLGCVGYVGNDSGISHLAALAGRPTVAIFGPSNPLHWRPLGKRVRVCRARQAHSSAGESDWPEIDEICSALDALMQG